MTGSKLIVDSALKAVAHLRSSKVPSELAKSSAALFSAYGGAAPSLPDLKYDYGALERKSIDRIFATTIQDSGKLWGSSIHTS